MCFKYTILIGRGANAPSLVSLQVSQYILRFWEIELKSILKINRENVFILWVYLLGLVVILDPKTLAPPYNKIKIKSQRL